MIIHFPPKLLYALASRFLRKKSEIICDTVRDTYSRHCIYNVLPYSQFFGQREIKLELNKVLCPRVVILYIMEQ